MYSRYHPPSDDPIRLPENYGGVAFSERNASKLDVDHQTRTLEVAKPSPPPLTPPPPDRPTQREGLEDKETRHPIASKSDALQKSLPLRHASWLPMGVKEGFPFAHGIGFEELFIIALIILISRNEEASDVVLWLTLLLFCG